MWVITDYLVCYKRKERRTPECPQRSLDLIPGEQLRWLGLAWSFLLIVEDRPTSYTSTERNNFRSWILQT